MTNDRQTGKLRFFLKLFDCIAETSDMRVLLVDDQPEDLWMMAELLELRSFTVQAVATVEDALAALCPHLLDVVVTDYHVGARNGCEIVRAATRLGIPCVLITGSANRDAIARSVNLGARFVLLKPFEINDLILRMHQAITEASIAEKISAILRKTGGVRNDD